MNDQQLTKLLHEADASRPCVEERTAPNLDALEARLVARRATKRRVAAATATAAVMVIVASALWLNSERPSDMATVETHASHSNAASQPRDPSDVSSPKPIDAGALRAEIARLELEIESRETFVAAMRRAETSAALDDEIEEIERATGDESEYLASAELRRAFNQTAAIRLTFADELAEDVGDLEAAAAEYRDVARCFPNTLWAKTATERLAHVGAM